MIKDHRIILGLPHLIIMTDLHMDHLVSDHIQVDLRSVSGLLVKESEIGHLLRSIGQKDNSNSHNRKVIGREMSRGSTVVNKKRKGRQTAAVFKLL